MPHSVQNVRSGIDGGRAPWYNNGVSNYPNTEEVKAMLRICVADDEPACIRRLEDFLARYFTLRTQQYELTAFSSGDRLLKNYAPVYDIIFLDIEMPGQSGMQTAARIREMDEKVILIFLTRMAQYAAAGYEVNAFDFIVKPVDYNSFSVKFGRALDAVKRRQEYKIEVRLDGGFVWLPTSSVWLIEVNKHDVTYHAEQGTYTARGSLAELEARLAPFGFRRCSRYCLVNMKFVTGIYDWYILLHGQKVEVSRRMRKELMEALLDYYGGNADD